MLKDYMQLTKPRIAVLNIITAVTAFLMAGGSLLHLKELVALVVAGYLAAGGVAALNCYVDSDVDKIMYRTSKRAIPSRKVSRKNALAFGSVCSFASLAISLVFINLLATAFIGLAILVYVHIYTLWLRRRTPWAAVVGGLVGSFPPLAGWTAVTNTVGLPAILLAVLIFIWSSGHFWGLAIRFKDEYRKAKIPVMPAVIGMAKACFYTASTNYLTVFFALWMMLYLTNFPSFFVVLLPSLLILYHNMRLFLKPGKEVAWKAFKSSVSYLAIICIVLIVNSFF